MLRLDCPGDRWGLNRGSEALHAYRAREALPGFKTKHTAIGWFRLLRQLIQQTGHQCLGVQGLA